MSSSIDALRAPVNEELRRFERTFRDSLSSKVGLLDIVTRYVLRQKGKRVRPLLVFLAAKSCGAVTDRTYRGAALVETLHTATLVHDDVVDDADTRRGLASINAVWKNKVAVLFGDYLLAKGLLLALDHNDYDFLHCTSTSVRRMSEGELLQTQKSRQLDITEQTYLQIIGDKTASLLSTCTEVGARSATEDPVWHGRFKAFGEQVGLAFQIRDDILDYRGRRSIIGKPTGADIKEKKITLPLIQALKTGPRSDGAKALRMVRRGASAKDIAWIIDFVEAHGGIDYAESRAAHFANQARASIYDLPDSDAKASLLQFVEFVQRRLS
ncbi:MAG: polyprenyl synthetase family protein [Bacteroidetes bacterium]|nr:polyprenyl synthetase family protein [Bacteroidota bacterium]